MTVYSPISPPAALSLADFRVNLSAKVSLPSVFTLIFPSVALPARPPAFPEAELTCVTEFPEAVKLASVSICPTKPPASAAEDAASTLILPADVFLNSAVRDVFCSIVLQNKPVWLSPLTFKSFVNWFSKVISALVPDFIVPIRPPTAAVVILSAFRFRSTIFAFKVASPPARISARSGFFVEEAVSEKPKGIVVSSFAFEESTLNNALDVIMEYCSAAVLASRPKVPS